MKNLNNKGITAVELLVCFIIVSAIVVSMFNLIMNYRNKEQIEEINNEVTTYINNLQKDIQDDLIKGHLVSVDNILDDSYGATFSLDTPNLYQTSITIDPTNGVISYGRVDNIIDYEIPSIPDLFLSSDSKVELISSSAVNYLKITIILTHPNFDDEEYSFTITCPINYIK